MVDNTVSQTRDPLYVPYKVPEFLNELCANCGFRYGSHNGRDDYSEVYKMHVPLNYCPGHEGRMDWNEGPGTVFKPTGKYKERSTTNE